MKILIKFAVGLELILLLTVACAGGAAAPTSIPNPNDNMTEMDGMDNMGVDSSLSSQDYAPLVGGFYQGGEVLFIHTETSDPEVATMLTEMMGGPEVIFVPELANAPASLLATVYVFTNGIEGHGPFGFQPDIFDSVPGNAAYRPLRNVLLVEWNVDSTPRELRSVVELKEAEAGGEIRISEPGIVVNFPVLVWPDGSR